MARRTTIKTGMTRKELAGLYKITRQLLSIRLKELGILHQGKLTPRELAYCLKSWGIPDIAANVKITTDNIPEDTVHPIDGHSFKELNYV